MSTRCSVIISSNGCKSKYLYHHCDGYPEGVGEELKKILLNNPNLNTPNEICDYINTVDSAYEYSSGVHDDIEYLYTINIDSHKLFCTDYINGTVEFVFNYTKSPIINNRLVVDKTFATRLYNFLKNINAVNSFALWEEQKALLHYAKILLQYQIDTVTDSEEIEYLKMNNLYGVHL